MKKIIELTNHEARFFDYGSNIDFYLFAPDDNEACYHYSLDHDNCIDYQIDENLDYTMDDIMEGVPTLTNEDLKLIEREFEKWLYYHSIDGVHAN